MPPSLDHDKRSYVALRQLRLGPDDYRDRGDAVPEASSWPYSAVVALINTKQLGEGPICDHSEELATINARLNSIVGQLGAASAERDAAVDERDAAKQHILALERQLSAAAKPQRKE